MEGETYIIHNFKILKNEGQYRVCEHPFKLLFIVVTSVKPQLIAQVLMKVFSFQSIKAILARNFIANFLIGMTNLFTILF